MPLYFAYGSNMDVAQMAERCPGSRPLGTARLARHRLVIMREGYASVTRDPRRTVWGLLWDLAAADLPALDRYEGVSSGLYTKLHGPVLAGGASRRALIYVGHNAGPGRPKPGYLEAVLAAAEAAGLPDAYRGELAGAGSSSRWSSGAAPRPTRASPFDPEPPAVPPGWRWTP